MYNETVKYEVTYKPTTLGRATSKCGIDLDISNDLFNDLKHGLEGMVLNNHLHLLYLITPYDSLNNIAPDWSTFMKEINRLSESELAAANFIGVTEQHLNLCAKGCISKKNKPEIHKTVCRFYVTLILYSLINGDSVWDVSYRFEQPRGLLQTLLNHSAGFASCVLRFSQEFDQFWPYQALFEKLIALLQYCRMSELIPLMEVSSVKLGRAKQLYNAGYKSLSQLAGASVAGLLQSIEHLSRRQASQIIASAKVLLTEKIETLQEEVEMLKNET